MKHKIAKTSDPAQGKMKEIGQILTNGIRRLEAKEISRNQQIQVDNKHFPSLYGVDSNLNQQAIL